MTRPQRITQGTDQPQISPLAHPTPQIYLPEDPYQNKKDIEARPTENLTNPDKDHSYLGTHC